MAAVVLLIFIVFCFRSLASELGAFDSHQHLYHSASTLSEDYQEMLDSFKVFIYPVIRNSTAPDFRDVDPGVAGSDRVFFDSLVRSSGFVTDDPEEAHLFLVPASVSSIRASASEKIVARALRGYIDQLRSSYPFWQRTLGADHVFISCQGFKSDWSRNVLELQKNAIQLACFPLSGHQEFLPHKDITFPGQSTPEEEGDLDQDRVHLGVYEAGVSWQAEEGFLAMNRSDNHHPELLLTTKYCLSTDSGDKQLVIDSVRSGCVPVIISSGTLSDLPFQDILDWSQFAIVLRHDQLQRVKHILESIPKTEYLRLKQNGAVAARHMEWHIPPRPHDAFYMVLYQLWRRHYVVRYADRIANLRKE